MKVNKTIRSFFLVTVLFLIFGCNAFAKETAPYVAKGTFVMEEGSTDYNICGAEIQFYNKSDLVIKDFTVVFFLFDGDGEPANTTKNSLVFNIKETVEAKESINLCVALDDYLNYMPEENYFIDYLYVSQINYADGNTWSDPFGMVVF